MGASFKSAQLLSSRGATVDSTYNRYHKAHDLRKEADGWRNVIATLNMQLKKARDEVARLGAGAKDAERVAVAEQEKV